MGSRTFISIGMSVPLKFDSSAQRWHMLDDGDTGFLVNTGKQLILVDAGSGTWYGGGTMGHLVGNLRSAGYTPEEVDLE
jgi:hypothetical protein